MSGGRQRRGRGRRSRLASRGALAVIFALACAGGIAWAAYSGNATSSGNELVAAADWVAPTASAAVIGKTQGGVPGYIRQGGTYNVYANVSDSGGPPSGIATVSANVSTITTAQTAAALSAGSFSIGAAAYSYRTANLTANAVLAAGSYSYSLASKDVAANSGTQSGYTVIVDNTAPTATDVQTVNKTGNIAGRPDIGDTLTLTFSEPIDAHSILANWTGAATAVVVRIANGGNDTLTVYNATNTTQLPLGSVNLGRTDYVNAATTFGASGTTSTMVQSANAITLTLGTASAGPTTASTNGTMTWTPSASAYDRAGNAETTTARSEATPADRDF
jgi:hypothetical protein